MSRRARKQLAHRILQEACAGIDPADDVARADAIRSLCPCRGVQRGPALWTVIAEACRDPSPHVRKEALHVIEDAATASVPNARGQHLLFAATRDPDPEVRRFAQEQVLRRKGGSKKSLRKWNARRHRAKRRRPRRGAGHLVSGRS